MYFISGHHLKILDQVLAMEAGSSACVALAFLVNYNTLKAGFVYDDR